MSQILLHAARRYISTTIARASKDNIPLGPIPVSGGHHQGDYKLWRNLTFFVAFPAIILSAANCVIAHKKHEHHERPPFVKYEYLAIRTKKFPWGDGNHSLFHNPRVNALPDGYEDEH